MSGSHWPHYPPCSSFPCETRECCALGHEFEWPKLVGKKGEEAKATIEQDNREVVGVFIKPGQATYDDFCCNRVLIYVDKNGIVTKTPRVG